MLSAPPQQQSMRPGGLAWLQVVLPISGGLAAMLFVVVNPKPIYVATAILFAFSAVAGGVGMGVQQMASLRRQASAVRARYLGYVGDLRGTVTGIAEAQRADTQWRHPSPSGLLSVAATRERLWERRLSDNDFLDVRVGHGPGPLAAPLEDTQLGSGPDASDPVCGAALSSLTRARGTMADLPITIALTRARVVSIVGPRPAVIGLARALVAQLVTWHAPNDLRMAFCLSEATRPGWDWAKWLPHLQVWAPAAIALSAPPALSTDAVALAAVLAALPRTAADGPWVVAVLDAGDPGPGTDQILRQAVGGRATLIHLAPDGVPEPADADLRLHLDRRYGLTVRGAGAERTGGADWLGGPAAAGLARRLAPLRLDREDDGQRLAGTIQLERLLGIGDARALDTGRLWRQRSLRERLRVPIGSDPSGADVVLDLKETALGGDGPHGLVIGATGSGKSELLKTIVAGLALTHSPELLSFVLVDFKGGAAFAGLSELPHVAGTITNLADDLALVDRMRDAVFGEVRRRQELLKQAGNLGSLVQYQQERARGAALEPLPYLLVVIDEFAELLAAKPDFIELFVAIGRLGRSLGVHLMLASQQLEEGRLRGLEGHLSYRFALRTFSATESRTVIGTPDAYELPPLPGSGYLKVGTTTFTRFRAATVSIPYAGPEETARLAALAPFGLAELNPPVTDSDADDEDEEAPKAASFLDVVVGQLRGAAPRVHQVWLPPLGFRLTLDAILPEQREAELVVPLGLVDRPSEQTTGPLLIDLKGTSGHLLVVGSSQTGKSNIMRTLVSALALTHTPLECQCYCVDFGGGGLVALERLPHVGGVCGRADDERLQRTIAEVAGLLDERERRFAAAGIDSAEAMRARRAAGDGADGSLADVLLVIDNWPAVRQRSEDLETSLVDIAQRGLGYGVHLVLTASRWMDVRAALREAIGGRLEFRLNDPSESAIDRRAAMNLAKAPAGRGLTAEKLHFQAALPRTDGQGQVLDLPEAVGRMVAGVAEAWEGPVAPPVRVLPRRVCVSEVPLGSNGALAVPIGLSGRDMGAVSMEFSGADPHLLVFGDGESGKTTLLRTLIAGVLARRSTEQARFLLVDYRRGLLGSVPEDYMLAYAVAEPVAAAAVAETAEALGERLPPADVTAEQLSARSWWKGPDVYVVVDDYDLVVTSSGSPLLPLLPLVAQAGDVGLHVIVARRVAGSSRGLYEPFLLRVRELGAPGIVLAGDPQEGALMGAVRASTGLPPGRGMLVRRRQRPELVQVAVPDC